MVSMEYLPLIQTIGKALVLSLIALQPIFYWLKKQISPTLPSVTSVWRVKPKRVLL